ncbi:MAG: transcriptional repressor LexA [Dehalococcoidia bacterium]|jgi:repressor LexA|nr:transcriptional repressor LexA [Dehalococcoidia bacterium]
MAIKSLSPKQERIIKFVTEFLNDMGYPPTIRDIAAGCGISSTSVVAYNLNKLEQAGYIRRHSDISRGIKFLTPQQKGGKLVYIPIVGVIAAGEPIPVPDTGNIAPNEGLEVSEELVRGKQDIYALRVKGDSMLDALIGDGDIVLMDYGNSAENGDMVAVWLKEEQEVTLKRFFAEPNRIRLEPANSQIKPIYTTPDNVEIQGRVVAVIRRIS